jgi:hypothetical protein
MTGSLTRRTAETLSRRYAFPGRSGTAETTTSAAPETGDAAGPMPGDSP